MKELEFVDWIRAQGETSPAVALGPGDDCAAVLCGGQRVLVTTDQLLDGVHFDVSRFGPEAFGRKAMARALSDLAAMAAKPVAAVASIALPPGFSRDDAEAMYRGRRSVSDEFRCPMVGGDVACWRGALAMSVTVFGVPGGHEPVLRSGAKPGDAVCVTGRLGGAWLTDRHLTFRPRIDEARRLAARCRLHAMIDISDGLALDLWRVCRASSVGAEVEAARVPAHDDAPAGRDITPLRAALSDGEDYELLFTLPDEQADELLRDQPLGVPVTRIGTIVAGHELTLGGPDGTREPLAPAGWEHETSG